MGQIAFNLTKDQREKIVAMYMLQYGLGEIAKAFGVNSRKLDRWLKRRENRELLEKCEQAQVNGMVQVRMGWMQKARDGDMKAVEMWMRAFEPSVFVTSTGNEDNVAEALAQKSERELEKMLIEGLREGSIPEKALLPFRKSESKKTKEVADGKNNQDHVQHKAKAAVVWYK